MNHRFEKNILITSGTGFIGSHVVRLFVNKYSGYHIINSYKLTYAGNLVNLKDIEYQPNYTFIKADICDFEKMVELFNTYSIDGVIHLAVENHVDRNIKDPFTFAQTNAMGTLLLLQAAKLSWEDDFDGKCFCHISTDEFYDTLQYDGGFFTESAKYDPHSPSSARKACSDHSVRTFHDAYGLPTIVTNCCYNYGSYQFLEKLIPLFVYNIHHGKQLPVYGKRENARDWLHVMDHARAIDVISHEGKFADTYNIDGCNECKNIDLIKAIIKTVDRLLGNADEIGGKLITYVTSPVGHDLRCVIDSTKLKNELGWESLLQFKEGIKRTVRWFCVIRNGCIILLLVNMIKYYNSIYNIK